MTEKNEIDDIASLFAMLDRILGGGPDIHSHLCPEQACGHIWTHDRAEIGPGEEPYEIAHTCPKCGIGKTRERHRVETASVPPHIETGPILDRPERIENK